MCLDRLGPAHGCVRGTLDDGVNCEGCDGSGVRCPATPTCVFPGVDLGRWTIVERCDYCELYPNDLCAGASRFSEVRWVTCPFGGDHAIARNGDGR